MHEARGHDETANCKAAANMSMGADLIQRPQELVSSLEHAAAHHACANTQPLGLATYQFALQPVQLAQQGIKACNGCLPGDWLMSFSTSGCSSSCCRWFRRFIVAITRVRRSWGCAARAEHRCRG